MASFYCLLFGGNLTSRVAPILDAKVPAFECNDSMLHMCSELAEKRAITFSGLKVATEAVRV